MAAASFGYQPGDGTGLNIAVVTNAAISATSFENDTGATVYIDQLDLLNVVTVGACTVQLAIYDCRAIGLPKNLLALSDVKAAIAAGTNSFAIVGDPLAVGPGQSVFVEIRSTITIRCDGATAPARMVNAPGGGATAFTSSQAATPGFVGLILPVQLVGDDVGPGDVTNLVDRLSAAQALSDGDPNVAARLMAAEAMSEGYPNVLARLMAAQVLFPVIEGGEMATDELNFARLLVSWEANKRIVFNGDEQKASNLRATRTALAEWPVYVFEVNFPFLEDGSPDLLLQANAFKYLQAFFKKMRANTFTWLYRDPDENEVVGGPLISTSSDRGLVGDGVTTDFWLGFDSAGLFQEPIGQLDTASGYRIEVAGAAVAAADFTFLAPNRISFDVAPAEGATLEWFGKHFFVCHFVDSEASFARFNRQLWEWRQVTFESVLQ